MYRCGDVELFIPLLLISRKLDVASRLCAAAVQAVDAGVKCMFRQRVLQASDSGPLRMRSMALVGGSYSVFSGAAQAAGILILCLIDP
jgi:hypothetical protein